MADLVVTAADVLKVAGSGQEEDGVLGEAGMTAGMSVYLKTSDRRWYKAQHDGTAAESGSGSKVGILLNGGGVGQPCKVLREGDLDVGATLTVGAAYYIGAGAGGIAPAGDLVTGEYVTLLGIATAADNLKLRPIISGVQVP